MSALRVRRCMRLACHKQAQTGTTTEKRWNFGRTQHRFVTFLNSKTSTLNITQCSNQSPQRHYQSHRLYHHLHLKPPVIVQNPNCAPETSFDPTKAWTPPKDVKMSALLHSTDFSTQGGLARTSHYICKVDLTSQQDMRRHAAPRLPEAGAATRETGLDRSVGFGKAGGSARGRHGRMQKFARR